MTNGPNDLKPSAIDTLAKACNSVGLNWLAVVLFAAGFLFGCAAAGAEDTYRSFRPGTGFFGAGCVIAAALVISRKPN